MIIFSLCTFDYRCDVLFSASYQELHINFPITGYVDFHHLKCLLVFSIIVTILTFVINKYLGEYIKIM